jgi:hypothetical protein
MVGRVREASESQLQILSQNRPRLLEEAAKHAVLWLGIADIKGKCPETSWLEGFDDPKTIGRDIVAAHKVAWSIQGVAGDPFEQVARAVSQVVARHPDPGLPTEEARTWLAKQVSELACELGRLAVAGMKQRADGKQRVARHTSWASKILHHAWPEVRSFVWDVNARLALNTHYRHRLSSNPPRGYDYGQFVADCEADLCALRDYPQFQKGMKFLLERRGSVLRDHCKRFATLDESHCRLLTEGFLERRLYDKYLWVEGDFIAKTWS